jgi:CHASE3 domain sensor protein
MEYIDNLLKNWELFPVLVPMLIMIFGYAFYNRILIKQNAKDDVERKAYIQEAEKRIKEEFAEVNSQIKCDRLDRKDEKRKIYENIDSVSNDVHTIREAMAKIETIIERELG